MVLTEEQARIDLAAAFRLANRLHFNEGVSNHFSLAVSKDGKQFLLNQQGVHFSRVKASDLLLLDADNPNALIGEKVPEATAWYLHGTLHQVLPQARCILHTHMPYITTLACLEEPEIIMINQNACRFYNSVVYDKSYDGAALNKDEGHRVASLLGKDKKVLVLGNHGVMVVGNTVAEAFDELYYLERVAQVQVLALSTQRKIAIIPQDVAIKTHYQWLNALPEFSHMHFKALKEILNEEEPDYRM